MCSNAACTASGPPSTRYGFVREVPMIVPPRGRMPEIWGRPSDWKFCSIIPRQPSRTPTTSWPYAHARRATARMTALRPGQSPPPVRTPMRTGLVYERPRPAVRVRADPVPARAAFRRPDRGRALRGAPPRPPRRPLQERRRAPPARPSATARGSRRSRRDRAPSPRGRSPAGTTRAAGGAPRFRRRRSPSRATAAPASRGSGRASPVLHELEAEPTLDAQVPLSDIVILGRRDVHDLALLHVELEVAADAAVRAHRAHDLLVVPVPRTGLAPVVLGLRHQRSGRADGDAVAAVHAGRLGQRDVEL